MDAITVIKQYLDEQHVAQLATTADNKPWICNLYYVADDNYNLYWASWPNRKHSIDITKNNLVAIAIAVHSAKNKPVAGLQIQGVAEMLIEPEEVKAAAILYAAKFGRKKAWIESIVAGETQHKLYRLKPTQYVLFDEVNFAANTRLELTSLG